MLGRDEVAPPFTLSDANGTPVSLADHAGSWVLLYWYPKADTPGCVAQAQGLRDQRDVFADLGCVILGASFDPVADLAAFAEKYALGFTLLSDLDHEVGRRYGVAGQDGAAAYASRIAYLIDPAGRIRSRYEVDDPEFFADHVLDDLESGIR